MATSLILWKTFWNRFQMIRLKPEGGFKTEDLPDLTKAAYALFDVMIEEFETENLTTTVETFRRMKKEFYDVWKSEIES